MVIFLNFQGTDAKKYDFTTASLRYNLSRFIGKNMAECSLFFDKNNYHLKPDWTNAQLAKYKVK